MSERITIVIETGSAAFQDHPTTEIVRILRRTARLFELGKEPSDIFDIKMNVCGSVKVEPMEGAKP